jgi:ornithine--oxo-acid transaminase
MTQTVETARPLSSAEILELEERYGAHNYHPLDIVITRGEGASVWDVEGKRYLDFLAAYSAVNQGHCHPRLIRVLAEQASRLTLCSRAFRNDQLGRLCEEISLLTGFQRFLPMNSGAEAVETAIKLARKWGQTVKGVPAGESEILVFHNNFHGRTTTIVGFSSNDQYREGFGPFAGGFRLLPYGDADAVEAAMSPRTIGVLVEPIQGEGGIIVPPDGYLRRLRELTDRSGILLLADEIQSGLGRTGALFAFEHEGIRPDLVVVGKALSGGFYPVSGILADDALMEVFKPGDHGSTFGGNPLGAAVAREALRVLVEEKLIERSAKLGAWALERLRAIDSPHIAEVRGRGLWIGVELKPEAAGARRFCEMLAAEGILCKETHTHVIRVSPPLSISQPELDWALERFEKVLRRP